MDRKSKVERLRANLESATQTQMPRGYAGDHQVIVIRNDDDFVAAKWQVQGNHPESFTIAILDLHTANQEGAA